MRTKADNISKKISLSSIQEGIVDRTSAIYRLFGWQWVRFKGAKKKKREYFVPDWHSLKRQYLRMAQNVLDIDVQSNRYGRLIVSKHENEEEIRLLFSVEVGQIIIYKDGREGFIFKPPACSDEVK